MKIKTKKPRLTSALLILLTASASQAALIWAPAAGSPNGEYDANTAMGAVISYGTLTLDTGSVVDYAIKLNEAFDLRTLGASNPAVAANNMFAVHPDGSADLYSSIESTGYVDISVCTFVAGSSTAGVGGTPLPVSFGITAPNYSPNTVTGSDGNVGANIARLNNNEELFSTTAIASVIDPDLQIETNGAYNNLGGLGTAPAGFAHTMAWEAATGNPFPGGTLQVSEATFTVNYDYTSDLRLRRDTDAGQNSAYGFGSGVPEPSSALLLTMGLVAGGLRRRR